MWMLILSIVGTLVPSILANRGVIGDSTDQLIASLMGPITTLIAGLKAGTTKTTDGLAILAAASGVIAVLQSKTGLSPTVLTEIEDVNKDIQAAFVAYALAGTGFDITRYSPIASVA